LATGALSLIFKDIAINGKPAVESRK